MGRKGVLAAAITASLIVASAASSGTVRGLITGLQIKNGSITSADFADGTISARDLAPSLRQAQSVVPGAAGAQGEAGSGRPPQWLRAHRPGLPPTEQSNFDILIVNNNAFQNGYRAGSGTATWKVVLGAGSYALDVMFVESDDAGEMTWTLDGAAVGTIDARSSGMTFNVQHSLDPVSVSDSGVKTLTVTVGGDANGGPGPYAYLQSIQLRRVN